MTFGAAPQKVNDDVFGEGYVEKVAKSELAAEGEPTELAPTVLFELFEDVHIFIFGGNSGRSRSTPKFLLTSETYRVLHSRDVHVRPCGDISSLDGLKTNRGLEEV